MNFEMNVRSVLRKFFPYDDRARRLVSSNFTEFRGQRNPPRSLGEPGDVFINEESGQLHVREESEGWSKPWDGSFENRISHPIFSNRYLWIVDSRLEFCSEAVIKLPKNKFFVKDFEKILRPVIDSSTLNTHNFPVFVPTPPTQKRNYSSVGDSASPSNDSKRGRISVVSPPPGVRVTAQRLSSRTSGSPLKKIPTTDHNSGDSSLFRSALFPAKDSSSHVSNSASCPVAGAKRIEAGQKIFNPRSSLSHMSSTFQSEPVRVPQLNRFLTRSLSLPRIENLSESGLTGNDDSDVFEAEVDELLDDTSSCDSDSSPNKEESKEKSESLRSLGHPQPQTKFEGGNPSKKNGSAFFPPQLAHTSERETRMAQTAAIFSLRPQEAHEGMDTNRKSWHKQVSYEEQANPMIVHSDTIDDVKALEKLSTLNSVAHQSDTSFIEKDNKNNARLRRTMASIPIAFCVSRSFSPPLDIVNTNDAFGAPCNANSGADGHQSALSENTWIYSQKLSTPIIDLRSDAYDYVVSTVPEAPRIPCTLQESIGMQNSGRSRFNQMATGETIQDAIDVDGYDSSLSSDIVNISFEQFQANVRVSHSSKVATPKFKREKNNEPSPFPRSPATPVSPIQQFISRQDPKESVAEAGTNGNHGRKTCKSVKKVQERMSESTQNTSAMNIDFLKATMTNFPAPSSDICNNAEIWPQRWHLRLLYRKDTHSSKLVSCACCIANARERQRQNLFPETVFSFPIGKRHEDDLIQHAREEHRESHMYKNIVRMSKEEVEMKMIELRAARKK